MRIAVDFDSTLWPMLPAMGFRYEDCPTWEHLPELCGGVPAMLARFEEIMSYEHMRLTPFFPGASDALRSLTARGAQLHLLTLRPEKFKGDVIRMLDDHQIDVVDVRCSLDLDKTEHCLEEGIGVLIDDSPDTIAQAAAAGLDVLLETGDVDSPY